MIEERHLHIGSGVFGRRSRARARAVPAGKKDHGRLTEQAQMVSRQSCALPEGNSALNTRSRLQSPGL